MFFTEPQRKIEIKGSYDVIVAGSGPSGIAAAITAARFGAKVLLVESQGTVGGISTSGMMSHFTGTVDLPLYRETLQRAADKNTFKRGEWTPTIHPELLSVTYLEMLEEAGVELLLYTFVCETIKENEKVRGVICENKSGRCAYMANTVIDGTGDGDVAFKAGASYFLGREEDEKMQPATLMFKVGGVDMEKAIFPPSFETTVKVPAGEIQSLARDHLPAPAGHVLLYRSTIPGVVTCNMTNVTGIDGTKAEDLTKAEIICRKQIPVIVEFLRKYAPGYENCYLLCAASLVGIRETRHFYGLSTLTEQDILEAKVFDDYVVRGAHFNFDVHNITGAGLDKTGVQKHFKQSKGYTIPYGCLVPKETEGLLLCGRNISGTHMAHSNFRAMPICFGIGAAAGAAAALSAKNQMPLREVSAAAIREILFGDEL
ncbi:MAG: FAD-dependent oxidoreductase [Clostridia bacterium]|nr:FAD-dependent oxidoreductase [Clostridia bacterium]